MLFWPIGASLVSDVTKQEVEDWVGVVSVDPDAIDIALPAVAAGTVDDLDILEFQVRDGMLIIDYSQCTLPP